MKRCESILNQFLKDENALGNSSNHFLPYNLNLKEFHAEIFHYLPCILRYVFFISVSTKDPH
jgi:hypothetical protein